MKFKWDPKQVLTTEKNTHKKEKTTFQQKLIK